MLQLGYNQISDLPALRLHGLLQLKVLHLQGNELVRVDGLGSLLQLRELVLDRNKIRQLEPHALRGPLPYHRTLTLARTLTLTLALTHPSPYPHLTLALTYP